MISNDRNILEKDSRLQVRLLSLSEAAGELVVFVPGESDEIKAISPHLTVYGVGGSKVGQFFKMWEQAKRFLSEKKADLITVQDIAFLAFLACRLARRFQIPFEVQVHGFERMRGLRAVLAGFVLRRADRIRVVSERLKRQIVSSFKFQVSRIYVLPVYTQIFIQPPSHGLATPFIKGDKEAFTFLTVGRLVPVKNIALQIRAFARIAKEFPNARLRIVGDGPLKERLKIKVERLKLGERIIFEGQQEHLEYYYKEADAFLLTSDSEGWGVAVTEAAAYGLPIIMTDVGLAGEFIINRENGIVIPVSDENALVSAMKRVVEDTQLRERLGEAAYRAYLALPSREIQIQKQVAQWQTLLF